MSAWEDACDPVPARREDGPEGGDGRPRPGRREFLSKAGRNGGKKGGARIKVKVRERLLKDVLSVDFSKPYRAKGA